MNNLSYSSRIISAMALLVFGLSSAAFGQMHWNSYDTSGNLITANIATGGDVTSGTSVTFTIPAGTRLFFVTKDFKPFNLSTANAGKVVRFQMSAAGGLTGATSGQEIIGWGCFNSAGTAGLTDDVGYFGMFNAANYTEPYYHLSGSADLFSGTKPGQGTTTTGFPTDNVVYTNQLFIKMNSTATGISLGTGNSATGAGVLITGPSVTQYSYINPVTPLVGGVSMFDEFGFMFYNTAGSSITVTLRAISLADTVTWDASGANPLAPTDGSGTWSVTNVNWAAGAVDNGWVDGQNAVFGSSGAPGTITINSGGVTVGNVTLNTNYTISGGTLTFTNYPTITVNGSATIATNTSILAGTGFTKEGAGTWRLAGTANNTYNGPVTINAGTLIAANNNTFAINGDLLVNPNGTFLYSQNSMINPTPTSTLIVNGGLVTNITSSTVLTVNKLVLDNNGLIRDLTGVSYVNATNYDLRSGSIFSSRYRIGGMNTFKSTAGTVVITNRPNSSGTDGHLVTMNGGVLIFDKSSQSANRLVANGGLTLGGGTLIFSNNNSLVNPSTENPGSGGTAINPGASSVLSTNFAPSTGGAITFGAFARKVGGTFDFFKNAQGSSTTTSGNANGITGGWATWNKSDWLMGTTLAPYASYTTSSDATTWVAANNVSLAGNPLANLDDASINSLRLTAASTVTINSTKTLTLSSGGLLVTGTGADSITGGALLGGSGADLIIHQYSTGDLTISSTLADNGTATSLTKSGTGKLIITGTDNMTGTNYLNGGVVEISDLAKLATGPLVMNNGALRYTGADVSSARAITLNGLGGTFDITTGITVTQNGVINGSGAPIGDLGGITKIGGGKLILTANNNFNGETVVNEGVLSINGTNTYNLATFNAGNVTVSGGILGGNGLIGGPVTVKNGGTISPGNSIGTLTLATNLTLESGATNSFEVTNSAAGDLLVVQGNLTIQTNCTISIDVLGTALEPSTNTLITYTGIKTGSFNPGVVVNGSLNSSVVIDESTPGQINLVAKSEVAITIQPQDNLVSTNDPATFTVTATGSAPLSYQWYFYGNNTNNIPVPLADATNAVFTINSAQSSDSGLYAVVVSNNFNSVSSRFALLIVGNVAPVLSGPDNVTVIAGNSAEFNVSVVIANPQPTFQWQTNGVDVANETGSSLTLNNVQFGLNNVTVSVIASNAAAMVTNSAVLTVIVTPVINPQPTNLTVNAGDTAAFVSGASGVPSPGLQWYKNGALLSGETAGTLMINNAQGANIGNYWLVASNSAGAVTSSVARLTVNSTTLVAAAFSPTNGATMVCYDTPLYVTFNGPISIANSGKIRIYNSTNAATPVDVIDMSSNTVIISPSIGITNNIQPHSLFSGDAQVINYFPVIISGSTAAIYPHGGVMTSNQTYYVTVDSGVVADSSGAYFGGISDTNAWVFTTKPTGPANPTNIVVAADGSGDFVTVQGAVDSVLPGNNNYTVINIHDGNYVEIVDISGKNNITFRGESRTGTVVGYANNNNLTGTTAARMAFKVNSADIKLENLTLLNSTPQGGSQAETLLIYNNGLRCVVDNCDIISRQDTILINQNTSQGYFNNCKVYGNFDYVWGVGVGYFNNCVFHTTTNTLSGSYNLTAARTLTSGSLSGTTPWVNPNGTTYSAYGFTFVGCTFEADNGVTGITLAGSNGTAGGLDSWTFCKFSSAYITPTTTLSNTYVFWQFQNTDTNGNPLSFANVQTLTNSDPRLLAATNVPVWFSGWQPQLLPNIIMQPVDLTVTAGETAMFAVSATGIPDTTYQWLQNGTNAPYGSANDATLIIANAQAADEATYSVIVSNSVGVVVSTNVTLTVIIPASPTFSSSVQVLGDGSVQFSFSGTEGAHYRVWATTDIALTPVIATWDLVGSGTFGASPVLFTDTQATNYPQRFYIITSP